MPERLDRFMARANAAYYASHDPFADFTTAPEIAQMFGELLGAWAAITWQQAGAPAPFRLIEAGPGRGTLMADALRATSRVAPSFRAAAQVHFIETSARLRAIQAHAVPGAQWHDRLEDVPDGFAIVLANEFADALPIRQIEHRGGAWRERMVEAGRFVTGETVAGPAGGAEGDIAEACDAAIAWTGTLAARIVAGGGAALILDYGRDAPGWGSTLQALRGGQFADPLADPGQADLTAHVDFPALAAAAVQAGAVAHGPVPQGAFLHALGLRVRTERLAASHPERARALRDAADRLASPARMGDLFKVLAVTPKNMPAPPGF